MSEELKITKDSEAATNAEAIRYANEALGSGWLLPIGKFFALAGLTVVGVFWFGWVSAAGAWVVVLWIKDVVGPAQFDNRRLISVRILPRRKNRRYIADKILK